MADTSGLALSETDSATRVAGSRGAGKGLRELTPRVGNKMEVSEDEVAAGWAGFFARIQRFTDVMLDRLVQVSSGNDADEKETRMLGGVIQEALNTWEKALHDGPEASLRLEAGALAKPGSRAKTGDE